MDKTAITAASDNRKLVWNGRPGSGWQDGLGTADRFGMADGATAIIIASGGKAGKRSRKT